MKLQKTFTSTLLLITLVGVISGCNGDEKVKQLEERLELANSQLIEKNDEIESFQNTIEEKDKEKLQMLKEFYIDKLDSAYNSLIENNYYSYDDLENLVDYLDSFKSQINNYNGNNLEEECQNIYEKAIENFNLITTGKDYEEEISFQFTILDSVNGTAEYIVNTNTEKIIKPVPNENYYFTHWEIKYNDGTDKISYSSILNISPNFLTIRPVFTNNKDEILEFEIDIEVENNLDVQIEILPYYTKGNNPVISYYVYENNDVILANSYITVLEEKYQNNVLYQIEHNIDSGRENLYLPYYGGHGWKPSFNGEVIKIVLEFLDLRDSFVVTIDQFNCIGCEKNHVFKKNETVLINSTLTKESFSSQEKYGEDIVGWMDENRQIVSNKDYFKIVVDSNKIFYPIIKKLDVFLQQEEINYSYLGFSENEDGTLTLEKIHAGYWPNVIVPSIVNGKIVTRVGNFLTGDGVNIMSLTLPNTIVNYEPYAFYNMNIIKELYINSIANLEFSMFKNYNSKDSYSGKIYLPNGALEKMLENEIDKWFVDGELTIEFVDSEHLDGASGHYEIGTQKICILENKEYYSVGDFWVILHEFRHFYQSVASGKVAGLSTDDLKVIPTENQIGAWTYTDYVDSSENYDKYWYNVLEIDAREWASSVIGYIYN